MEYYEGWNLREGIVWRRGQREDLTWRRERKEGGERENKVDEEE